MQNLVGVRIERAAQSADPLVIGKREHDGAIVRLGLCAHEHAVEAILQQRKLVGAANEAVIALLATALGRPRRDLTLLRGATARIKLIGVALD